LAIAALLVKGEKPMRSLRLGSSLLICALSAAAVSGVAAEMSLPGNSIKIAAGYCSERVISNSITANIETSRVSVAPAGSPGVWPTVDGDFPLSRA